MYLLRIASIAESFIERDICIEIGRQHIPDVQNSANSTNNSIILSRLPSESLEFPSLQRSQIPRIILRIPGSTAEQLGDDMNNLSNYSSTKIAVFRIVLKKQEKVNE